MRFGLSAPHRDDGGLLESRDQLLGDQKRRRSAEKSPSRGVTLQPKSDGLPKKAEKISLNGFSRGFTLSLV